MSLFLYLDRDTWLHRLDARTKLLGILALFVIGLLFSDPRYLIAPSILVIMLAWATRCAANLWRFRVLLSLLFLYSLLLWPWFVRGSTPFLKIGGTILTREALEYGLAMGMRLDFMLITGILLISATKVEEFTMGLQRLGLPPPIGFTLSLAFRWVPTLIGASKTIVQAQRARGLDLGGFGVTRRSSCHCSDTPCGRPSCWPWVWSRKVSGPAAGVIVLENRGCACPIMSPLP
jgi:energy-coupling factor transport system permease protein